MKTPLFIFILFINLSIFSQTIKGVVLDESEQPISNVTIYNSSSQKGVVTGSRGEFSMEVKQGDLLIIRYIGKQKITYKILKTNSLVIYKVFKLKESKTKLKEFVVTGSRIKKVSVKNNENILDYLDLGREMFLVLKKRKSKYYVSIEGVDTVYRDIPLKKWKPKSLFKDCLGNIHLLCKDSVRQLYLGEKLQSVSTISHLEFNQFLKTSIYMDDSVLISYSFANHNKKYRVFSTKKRKIRTIYQAFDMEAEKVAHSLYDDNDPMNKGETRRERFERKSWYKQVIGKEIYVKTYVNNKLLYTFDFFNKNLQINNVKGESLHKTKFYFNVKKEKGKVLLDKYKNVFYSYTTNNGIVSLEKMDVKSGEVTSKFTLKEHTFPKKVKVLNGWVYFIKINRAGFHKLYRVEI